MQLCSRAATAKRMGSASKSSPKAEHNGVTPDAKATCEHEQQVDVRTANFELNSNLAAQGSCLQQDANLSRGAHDPPNPGVLVDSTLATPSQVWQPSPPPRFAARASLMHRSRTVGASQAAVGYLTTFSMLKVVQTTVLNREYALRRKRRISCGLISS